MVQKHPGSSVQGLVRRISFQGHSDAEEPWCSPWRNSLRQSIWTGQAFVTRKLERHLLRVIYPAPNATRSRPQGTSDPPPHTHTQQ